MINLTKFSSQNIWRKKIDLSFINIDLESEQNTAETIGSIQPDLILNTATLQTYWIFDELPQPIRAGINSAGVGPWTSLHMYPVYKLMKAIKLSDCNAFVINTAFPDAVNPALKTLNLSPDSGAGNLANLVPAIIEAARIQCPEVNDDVIYCKFTGHHSCSNSMPSFGHTRGAPYSLNFYVNGDDITSRFDISRIGQDIKHKLPRTRGKEGMWVTGSSVVNLIKSVLSEDYVETHAPGIDGLPGGYPVLAGKGSIKLSLPETLDQATAIKINEDGQKYDGIEEISPEGYLNYTERSSQIIEDVTGITLDRFIFNDVEDYSCPCQRESFLKKN